MTVKIFVSEHCKPCQEIKKMVEEGRFTAEDIELVDIETDEGFETFSREVLEHGDGAVPSAYKEGAKCKILIDEEQGLIFNCPSEQGSQQSEDQSKDTSA